jgi:hypothetical protein
MAADLGRRTRPSAAPVVVAAIAVGVLAAATVAALLGAWGADRDLRAARDDRALATDPGAVDLVRALQSERNYAGVYLLGMEDTIASDVASFGDATAATDQGRARLGDGTPEGLEARLGEVRAAVTGAADRSLAATDAADLVVAEYTALIGAVLEADASGASSIEDPDLRRGAHLVDLSAIQGAQVGDAYRTSLLAAVNPAPTPDSVEAQARRVGSVVSSAAEIEGLATGPYAALAAEHLPDDDLATLVPALEAGLTTDPPVTMLAQAARTTEEVAAGYAAFGDGVQAAVDQRADDLEADANARRLVMVALAAAATVGAVAAAVVLAVLLQRRVSGPAAAGH